MVFCVRVEPGGLRLDVFDGETIMQAAERSGYDWPTVCRGEGTCGACFVRVTEGASDLPPTSEWEADGLAPLASTFAPGEPVRLACQLRPRADMVVRKTGVRPRALRTA